MEKSLNLFIQKRILKSCLHVYFQIFLKVSTWIICRKKNDTIPPDDSMYVKSPATISDSHFVCYDYHSSYSLSRFITICSTLGFFLINMHNFYLVCYFYLRHNVFLSLFFLYFFLSRKNILNDCSRFIKYDHYVTSRKKELWNDHPPSFYFKCLFITICLPIIYYQNVPEWFSLLMIYLLTFKSEKGKVH